MLQAQVKVSFNFNPVKYLVFMEIENNVFYLADTDNNRTCYWSSQWELALKFKTDNWAKHFKTVINCQPCTHHFTTH